MNIMPAKSKAQYRFMQAIAHGWRPKGKKKKSTITKDQAKEFVQDNKGTKSYKKLPAKVAAAGLLTRYLINNLWGKK